MNASLAPRHKYAALQAALSVICKSNLFKQSGMGSFPMPAAILRLKIFTHSSNLPSHNAAINS